MTILSKSDKSAKVAILQEGDESAQSDINDRQASLNAARRAINDRQASSRERRIMTVRLLPARRIMTVRLP